MCSRSCETKLPLQRSDSSKDGLKELAALLFSEGSVEGKGEMFGHQPFKKLHHMDSSSSSVSQFEYVYHNPSYLQRSVSKQNSLDTNSTFSQSLAEEIRLRLESHSKMLKLKRRSLTRDNSFDISSPSPCSSKQLVFQDTKSNKVDLKSDYEKKCDEDPWEKRQPISLTGTPQKGILKDESRKSNKTKTTNFDSNPTSDTNVSNGIASEPRKNISRAHARKKILKRSSKIDVEPQFEASSSNSKTDLQSNGILNQENENSVSSTNKNGTVRKTKPILKRSEHFEISVDKNSLLRKSESVKKVLNKDLNLYGKLLQIQSYNDISFDSNFEPVHR